MHMKFMLLRAVLVAAFSMPLAALAQTTSDLVAAAGLGETAAVVALLDKGLNPDAQQGDGRTALMAAAASGYFETVKALMIRGAHKELTDATGRTAFDYAFAAKHTDIIALLRDAS
jgi:ankyrin repeat protein